MPVVGINDCGIYPLDTILRIGNCNGVYQVFSTLVAHDDFVYIGKNGEESIDARVNTNQDLISHIVVPNRSESQTTPVSNSDVFVCN